MIICKDCRCFHPLIVSDLYCGECVNSSGKKDIETMLNALKQEI